MNRLVIAHMICICGFLLTFNLDKASIWPWFLVGEILVILINIVVGNESRRSSKPMATKKRRH